MKFGSEPINVSSPTNVSPFNSNTYKLVPKIEDFKQHYSRKYQDISGASQDENHTFKVNYDNYPGDQIFECIQNESSYDKFREVPFFCEF